MNRISPLQAGESRERLDSARVSVLLPTRRSAYCSSANFARSGTRAIAALPKVQILPLGMQDPSDAILLLPCHLIYHQRFHLGVP